MKAIRHLMFWMSVAFVTHAIEPVRKWTSSDGRTFQGRMLSSQAESVTVMNQTGQTYVIPFPKLSAEDVEYVQSVKARGSAPAYNGGWLDDFEKAQKIAKAQRKPILMLFTGSDWCPYCVKLEGNVLDKTEFKSFADEELVLMMVDFPRRKKLPKSTLEANKKLSAEYGIRGFPRMVMLDKNGKTLSSFGYGGQDAEKFVAELKSRL